MGKIKHGMSNTKIYFAWQRMKSRCSNHNSSDAKHYVDRGITYDTKWKSFEEFYKDMYNGYEEGLELDRINNDGNYCKENCRWVNRKTQNNNKRNNHPITYNGQSKTIAEWAEELGIKYPTLNSRINRGWSNKMALTTPLRHRNYTGQ